MIPARSPFQIYRSNGNESESVAVFNSLSPEKSLPYTIEASEESLVEALQYIQNKPEEQEKYAVCLLHYAATYLDGLIAYTPLQMRDSSLPRMETNFDALVNCAARYGDKDGTLVEEIRKAEQASKEGAINTTLSDIETRFKELEKERRLALKQSGTKVEMFRKSAPVVKKAVRLPPSQPRPDRGWGGRDQEAKPLPQVPFQEGRRRQYEPAQKGQTRAEEARREEGWYFLPLYRPQQSVDAAGEEGGDGAGEYSATVGSPLRSQVQ
ncbi:hypothetical protein AGDE_15061 [Angomonas deanei]|uniref:Uncharacterized protein n=1 Tax=Angomonas deanei TaxID=59799 RepID=A0A7G2C613_9TRYP|nr:hypothetical protein AGDE_15061 [Angomonas deanei]CAD2214197.1 hypothetical protein, conserved [Angomonas deanei]|eukprot:EPY19750.1 hypothetical protein AGDE_15061 [Angomonas deanei]